MSRIFDNLGNMSNVELNALAKNYWTDENIQDWIAANGNIQARYYLAGNPGISDSAAETLLSGRSLKAKAMLVSSGKLQSQETIRNIFQAVYDRNGSSWGYWKYWQTFINNPWEYRKSKPSNTPSDVIMKVFNMYWHRDENSKKDLYRYAYTIRNSVALLKRVASHKNCPLEIGIILSSSDSPEIIKVGRDILVNAKRQKKQVSDFVE